MWQNIESPDDAPHHRTPSLATLEKLAKAFRVKVADLLGSACLWPYCWSERTGTMKPFTRIAVVVLWLIALVQLLRFILRWEVTLNGAPIPLWLSGLVAVLAAGLAIMVWRERPR